MYRDEIEIYVTDFIQTCQTCQRFKKIKEKYWKLPPKKDTMIIYETICTYLIGSYTVTISLDTDIILNAMTFFNSASPWFEK